MPIGADPEQGFQVHTVGEGPTTDLGGATLAGHELQGRGRAELLTAGGDTMLVRLLLEPGFDQNGHDHPEHESIGYVVSGRVEMSVGDKRAELGPGDTWYHPRGVRHTCRALEPAEILEFHAPLRSDVLGLFSA